MTPALVIGYGNTLRGDDGAGVRAAEILAARGAPADVLTLQELLPETAETIARYRCVIFVDASAGAAAPTLTPLAPAAGPAEPATTHSHSPAGLLALAGALYGAAPEALLAAIPASDFAFRETLSPGTAAMVEESVRLILDFLAKR